MQQNIVSLVRSKKNQFKKSLNVTAKVKEAYVSNTDMNFLIPTRAFILPPTEIFSSLSNFNYDSPITPINNLILINCE